jgi:D-alanyl-D-alanine carboxypeptidase
LTFILVFVARTSWAIEHASIVVDAETGKVLHAVDPDTRVYPASLTKLMTLYLTFQALQAHQVTMDQKLPVSAWAASRPPSKLGVRRGQSITVKQAISALVTKSANDVASVLAEALGKTESHFAEIMTAKAHQLGMARTRFRNASGLPDRDQVTTARDMVKLALALQHDFPQYYRFFSLKSFTYRGRVIPNHNHLLARYEGTDGMKTGYVHESGFNIVVSVRREGHHLIAAVFGGNTAASRDRQTIRLLNQAFASIEQGPVVASARPTAKLGVAAAQVAAADTAAVPGWSIQVGAFNHLAPARRAATRAVHKVPSLASARIAVIPGDGLYRARLLGLSHAEARSACRQLKRKKMGCMILKVETQTAEGDQ